MIGIEYLQGQPNFNYTLQAKQRSSCLKIQLITMEELQIEQKMR